MNEKRIRLRNFKLLVAVVTFILVTAVGMGTYQTVKAADGTQIVTFDSTNDKVTVTNSAKTAYTFYTTANASKSVPAQNQWLRTDKGAVDVSNFTSGKTLYFAMSTDPNLEDIVPVKIAASPVLASAKYDASKDEFVFKAKVTGIQKLVDKSGAPVLDKNGVQKTKNITETVVIPNERIQIKLNDNSANWQDFSTAWTDSNKAMLQKEGATIYARIKPSTKAVSNFANNLFTISDGGANTIVSTDANKTYNDTVFVRYGISKAIKISKKTLGPVATIDYANHCMTIKKGQSYGKTTNAYADPSAWTAFSSDNPKVTTQKVYFGTNGYVSSAEYYALRTDAVSGKSQDSLLTFIAVPTAVGFDTTSEATIQGGYGETATLQIKYTPEAKSGVSYQYAIVDVNDTEKYKDLIATNKFDYSNANVKWTTVKTDKTGIAKVSLSWSKIKDKQVVVRKAAVGKEYSSAVEIFNAPGGTGVASYTSTAKALEVNCWTKLTNANYGTGFIGNNTSITFCPNITLPVYDAANGILTYYVVGANSNINPNAITFAIGKKKFTDEDVSSAIVGVAENQTVKISTKSYSAANFKITMTLGNIAGYDDIAKSNALAITLNESAGFFTVGNISSVARINSVKIDNKQVTLKSAVVKADTDTPTSGTITLTFDSKLKMVDSGNDVDLTQSNILGNAFTVAKVTSGTKTAANVTIEGATYSWNTKKSIATVVISYTGATQYGEEFTITLPQSLTDLAGNYITSGPDGIFSTEGTASTGSVIKVKNPCYEGS